MSKRIVLIGECMVELYQTVESVYHQTFAGDVYNTAVYLRRCVESPLQVQFMTAIGTDLISDKMLRQFEREKINIDGVYRTKRARPGLYMINTDAFGERSFVYWRDSSAAKQTWQLYNQQCPLTAATTAADTTAASAIARHDLLEGADSIYLSGISLAILSPNDRAALLARLTRARAEGSQIIFDPNYRPTLWPDAATAQAAFIAAYQIADVALPGLDDHRVLFDATTTEQVVTQLSALGVKEIVVKNGKQGISGRYQGSDFSALAQPVKRVLDTTAAGDSFNGGYLAARCAGVAPAQAVKFAACLAGFVVEHTGAIVSKEHFTRFWSQHRPSHFA